MNPLESIKACQTALGELVIDGLWGPKSAARLAVIVAEAAEQQPAAADGVPHNVIGSSFADPGDVAAFRTCKAHGNSDQFCFGKGDNGIGKWGDDTTADRPQCALPPEIWKPFGLAAHNKIVKVTRTNSAGETFTVYCRLTDTMPHLADIKNGAGIDMNPAAWKALGQTPPVMLPVTWSWAASDGA